MTKTITAEDVLLKIANTKQAFADGRNLFNQYANSLDIDLSFQDFSNELETIHKQYNKPAGALLLAYKDNIAVGCAGIRQLEKDIAELKRMYVQPGYRKNKTGVRLLEFAVAVAKDFHYKKIRLDTLPTMTRAQALYRSFGFYEIPPYRFNPVNGTVFMEKQLT